MRAEVEAGAWAEVVAGMVTEGVLISTGTGAGARAEADAGTRAEVKAGIVT